MTCIECVYHNPYAEHNCNKYPAILPIDGIDICASFKPNWNNIEHNHCEICGRPTVNTDKICDDCKKSSWESVSK